MSHSQSTFDRFRNRGLGSFGKAAEDIFGALVAGSFGAADSFALWVTVANGWIIFFLSSLPLWDLTWNWEFFEVFHQRVNPQAIVGVLVLALNSIVILNRRAWRRLPRRVLVFLGFATVSVITSLSSEAFSELLRGLTGMLFFYTAGPLLATQKRFNLFAKLFLCATSVPVVLCFFQVVGIVPYNFWDVTQTGMIGRADGTYHDPVSLAYFLYVAFPLAIWIAYGKKQPSSTRKWAWVFLVLALGALLVSFLRTAYFIVALQFCIFFVMSRRWKTLMRLGVILTLITLFSSARLGKLYAPLWQSLSGDTSWESGQFFRGRGLEWFVYLRSYESSGPFHWFFGTGSSAIEGRFLLPLELVKFKPEPHNDYIRILHSYGAVGLLSYLFVLALLIRKALHLLSLEDEFASSLGGITLLILSAVLVESSVDEVLFYPAGAWYLFAIGSAMFCVPRVQGNGPHVAPASSPEETTA